MVAFDAEVYLRRLGERLLDDPCQPQPGHWSALRDAAVALVGVGAIDADQAWRVIDDCATVRHVRSGQPGFVHFGPPLRRHETGSLAPRQFRMINEKIMVSGHQVLVRDLAITADGGALRYRRYMAAPGLGDVSRMVRRPGVFPWNVAATAPDIRDSEGHRPSVRFGDRGRDGEGYVDGELELGGTIAPEAEWLEIDGTRVDLHGPTARWEGSIEALEDQSPLERLLWRHLAVAVPRSGVTRDLEPMIEALIGAGALEEGSLLIKNLRSVKARMPRRPLHQRRIRRAPASSLVEPWGSLLDREGAADDGPEWTRVLSAVAPSCDGVQFAANSITSDLDGFEVEFDVAPHVLANAALDELPVAWWARDDRENHYLGIPTGGGVRDGAQGTMRYWPALDPRAKRLELLMCVDSHQAVISVSLPDSSESSR